MMGRKSAGQKEFYYEFCLDQYVSQDHVLRGIDLHLDLSKLREHLAPFYSHTGRPSVDPELMVRMLLVGYCFGIRSERQLCQEVHVNLAYRWFCRLDLDDEVPAHSTFSKNRHGRFRDSDTLRFVFEQVVGRCIEAGLVGGEGFAIDASIVKADANRQHGAPGVEGTGWDGASQLSRPVREYLAALDEASGRKAPKYLSLTDPSARWTAAPGCPAFFGYSTNYLIDIDAGVIVDVEATPAYRSDEINSTKTMVERVQARFELKPQRLIGDTNYGTAPLLGWMVDEQGIEPHVPVWDKSQRTDGTFGRSDFVFDTEHDCYICPAGKVLHASRRKRKRNPFRYNASLYDCQECALKTKCCPNVPSRRIVRTPFEPARDVARALAKTAAYQQSRNDRKKVEILFAHLKRILKLDRLRLRGLSGAHDEFLLAATAQNLRRMAKLRGPPQPQAG